MSGVTRLPRCDDTHCDGNCLLNITRQPSDRTLTMSSEHQHGILNDTDNRALLNYFIDRPLEEWAESDKSTDVVLDDDALVCRTTSHTLGRDLSTMANDIGIVSFHSRPTDRSRKRREQSGMRPLSTAWNTVRMEPTLLGMQLLPSSPDRMQRDSCSQGFAMAAKVWASKG